MDTLVPSEFYLSQNFPNPFKGITRIKYCLPVKTEVELTLMNSSGTEMKKLVHKTQEAGTYEIKINSKDLTDDFDSYRLQAFDIGSSLPVGETSSRLVFAETRQMRLRH